MQIQDKELVAHVVSQLFAQPPSEYINGLLDVYTATNTSADTVLSPARLAGARGASAAALAAAEERARKKAEVVKAGRQLACVWFLVEAYAVPELQHATPKV